MTCVSERVYIIHDQDITVYESAEGYQSTEVMVVVHWQAVTSNLEAHQEVLSANESSCGGAGTRLFIRSLENTYFQPFNWLFTEGRAIILTHIHKNKHW